MGNPQLREIEVVLPFGAHTLRERLIELRDGILDRMMRKGAVEPGHLPMLGGIAAALAALHDGAIAGDMEAARAAVSDDGREIRLTLYREADALAAVTLSPEYAITIAGRLLDTAGLRLGPRSNAHRTKL